MSPADRTFGELTPGVLVLAVATFARLAGSLGEALPVATNAAATTTAAARRAASGRRIVRIMFPPVSGAGSTQAHPAGDATAARHRGPLTVRDGVVTIV